MVLSRIFCTVLIFSFFASNLCASSNDDDSFSEEETNSTYSCSTIPDDAATLGVINKILPKLIQRGAHLFHSKEEVLNASAQALQTSRQDASFLYELSEDWEMLDLQDAPLLYLPVYEDPDKITQVILGDCEPILKTYITLLYLAIKPSHFNYQRWTEEPRYPKLLGVHFERTSFDGHDMAKIQEALSFEAHQSGLLSFGIGSGSLDESHLNTLGLGLRGLKALRCLNLPGQIYNQKTLEGLKSILKAQSSLKVLSLKNSDLSLIEKDFFANLPGSLASINLERSKFPLASVPSLLGRKGLRFNTTGEWSDKDIEDNKFFPKYTKEFIEKILASPSVKQHINIKFSPYSANIPSQIKLVPGIAKYFPAIEKYIKFTIKGVELLVEHMTPVLKMDSEFVFRSSHHGLGLDDSDTQKRWFRFVQVLNQAGFKQTHGRFLMRDDFNVICKLGYDYIFDLETTFERKNSKFLLTIYYTRMSDTSYHKKPQSEREKRRATFITNRSFAHRVALYSREGSLTELKGPIPTDSLRRIPSILPMIMSPKLKKIMLQARQHIKETNHAGSYSLSEYLTPAIRTYGPFFIDTYLNRDIAMGQRFGTVSLYGLKHIELVDFNLNKQEMAWLATFLRNQRNLEYFAYRDINVYHPDHTRQRYANLTEQEIRRILEPALEGKNLSHKEIYTYPK